MVATDRLLEDHVTTAVRSRVVPSENTPVALKAWARATAGTAGLLGVTSSDTSTAFVTVSVVEPEIEPNCAEIWVVPGDFPWQRHSSRQHSKWLLPMDCWKTT